MRALILSAGLGERLRPLTLQRAKPAIEFLNMPMLAFPYFHLEGLNLSDVVFNTHHLPDSVRKAAMNVVSPNTQLHFCHEPTILGSGGGIWNARFHLQWDEDFAAINADGVVTFMENDTLEQMMRFHRQKKALATLLCCPVEGVGTRFSGAWVDNYGEIMNFGKTPRAAHVQGLFYASYMFLSRRILDLLPEGPSNILYDVIEPAIAQGEKVYAFTPPGMRWFETGNAPDFLASSRECLGFISSHDQLGEGLKRMLERFSPDSQLRGGNLVSSASTMNGVHLKGFNVIGADAKIENGTLEDCVVLPGAHVTGSHKSELFI